MVRVRSVLSVTCALWWAAVVASPRSLAQVAELQPLERTCVVGAPLIVDFVIRNDQARPIQARVGDETALAELEPRIDIFSGDDRVGRWAVHSSGAASELYKMRDRASGAWLFELAPGGEFRCRQTAVLLAEALPSASSERYGFAPEAGSGARGSPTGGREGVRRAPLGPGRYNLAGEILWVDGLLRTAPVSIEIVAARSAADRAASELVDEVFRSFMADSSAPLGVAGGEPIGSAKEILDRFPGSAHARMARPRALLHRARFCLAGDVHDPRRQALVVDDAIAKHLVDNAMDPLERELLYARVQLLTNFEVMDKVDWVLDQLRSRHARSGYTTAAERLVRERRGAPGTSPP